MDQYPPNTKTVSGGKPERVVKDTGTPKKPEIKKIVTGEAVMRKRSYSVRLRETFFGGVDSPGIFRTIFTDVIVPSGRDLLFDAGMSSLEQMIFRGSRPSNVQRAALRTVATGAGQVAYNRFAGQPSATVTNSTSIRRPTQDPRPQLSHEARRSHNFGEIVLGSRAEATAVIQTMMELIAKYDTCSVADLYKMVGEDPEFTDESWGWDRLDGAGVHRDSRRGGYVLNLPRPEPLA